jgi:3-oxoacyl-[acyl-carrier protein] reductase
MGRLDGRVIIVTGGAQGIGRAFCLGFAREGAKIVIADINGPATDAVVSEIGEAGGEAFSVVTDVSNEDSTNAMAAATIEHWGRIDGLVNNAAFFQRPQITNGPIEEIPVEEWDRVMAVNLKGPFLCCRAVIGQMKEQHYGKIVNISSGTFFSGRSTAHYVASKGGVIAFTRVLAKQSGDWSITVNTIAPGSTASDPDVDEGRYQGRVPDRSIKRVEQPEDLVGAGVFLMSSESDFMTGQTMVVDGGAVMH